jgi:hypothetical protein
MASTCSRITSTTIAGDGLLAGPGRSLPLIEGSSESAGNPYPAPGRAAASSVCHARCVSYNDVVWLPNALVMTAVLAAIAVWRWRSKGALVGLRWTGVAMLPLALYAIGLFRLVWSVSLAVSRFVTGFAFRPSVWIGLFLALVAVVLIVLPSKVERRLGGSTESRADKPAVTSKRRSSSDDDMAEIEDILKKHGLG